MPRFARFGLRDLGIATLAALAWQLDRHVSKGEYGGAVKTVVGLSTGLLTAALGFAAHEWGHLAATLASGGVAHEPESLSSPFLFSFDVEHSDRRAFLAMSAGGYLGTLVAASVITKLVPRDRLSGKIALGATALGVAATLVLEVPTTLRVALGGPLPRGGVYAGNADRARNH